MHYHLIQLFCAGLCLSMNMSPECWPELMLHYAQTIDHEFAGFMAYLESYSLWESIVFGNSTINKVWVCSQTAGYLLEIYMNSSK